MGKSMFTITPLGAAIVEALPDQQAVRRVKARFCSGRGVASRFFSLAEADAWAEREKQERAAEAAGEEK